LACSTISDSVLSSPPVSQTPPDRAPALFLTIAGNWKLRVWVASVRTVFVKNCQLAQASKGNTQAHRQHRDAL